MSKPESFLVACDIGTSKICVLIGEQNAGGSLDVIGKGAAANRGTRKGNIINVDATIEAIKRAAEEAEIMAGVQISRAWVGVSGSHVRSFPATATTPRPGACKSLRIMRLCTSCPGTSPWTDRTESPTRSG